MKLNDWELIGTDINKLQELISLLEKQVQEESEKHNNEITEENIIQKNIIE